MLRLRPPVLGLCSWSCLNLLNLCGGETEAPKPERNVRQFSMSAAKVKLPPDARLYEDQNLSCTQKGKTKINTDRVAINQLKAYLGQMSPELVKRTLTDNNSQLTKITQNLYVTSLGGLKEMNLKRRKVNLLLNASIDLPMVDMGNVETIRVPITEKEPDSVSLYASDVADLIQENYCKDGQTLIYCHDGNRNSIALSTGYLLKYTDLFLSEALLHLQCSRKGFDLINGNLGAFKKPIEAYAKKLKKFDQSAGNKSCSVSGTAQGSTSKKGGGGIPTSKKVK